MTIGELLETVSVGEMKLVILLCPAKSVPISNIKPTVSKRSLLRTAHRVALPGGRWGHALSSSFLNPAPNVRFSSIKRLADDLALAMRVPTLSIDRGRDGIVLEFSNPNPSPVSLISLLDETRPLPAATALLGLTDDGSPLLARLSAPEVAHILVSGTTGSGKSVLLLAMAASLALAHRPDVLRMLCIDPKGRTFRALKNIPHLTRPIVVEPTEAVEALQSLIKVMEIAR